MPSPHGSICCPLWHSPSRLPPPCWGCSTRSYCGRTTGSLSKLNKQLENINDSYNASSKFINRSDFLNNKSNQFKKNLNDLNEISENKIEDKSEVKEKNNLNEDDDEIISNDE